MPEHIPTYDEALAVFQEFNQSESLMKHAYAVEGVMGYLARKMGEDEGRWRVIGLVHDLDYERFPAEHCQKTQEILEARGWPQEYVRAAISHGWGFAMTLSRKVTWRRCSMPLTN